MGIFVYLKILIGQLTVKTDAVLIPHAHSVTNSEKNPGQGFFCMESTSSTHSLITNIYTGTVQCVAWHL